MCCYHSFPRAWQTVFGFTLATCIWVWYASDNNFVELRVIAGRSRTLAVSPRGVPRRPCCAVVLRRTALSGMAWARHGKCESYVAALCKSNGKDTSKPLAAWHGMGAACYVWIGLKCVYQGIGCSMKDLFFINVGLFIYHVWQDFLFKYILI